MEKTGYSERSSFLFISKFFYDDRKLEIPPANQIASDNPRSLIGRDLENRQERSVDKWKKDDLAELSVLFLISMMYGIVTLVYNVDPQDILLG